MQLGRRSASADRRWNSLGSAPNAARLGISAIGGERFEAGATVADALRRPSLGFTEVAPFLSEPLEAEIGERLAIEIKVEGYVRRELLAIEKAARTETVGIPEDLDYASIPQLSREAREKFAQQRPRTLGAAGRIPGATPSDIAILAVFVHKNRQRQVDPELASV